MAKPPTRLIVFFLLILIPYSVLSAGRETNIPAPENFDALLNQVNSQIAEIATNKATKKQRKSLRELSRQKKQLEAIDHLRADLKNLYTFSYPQISKQNPQLNQETTRLAVGLAQEVQKLKKHYRLFPIPLVHNFFITLGLKKRGACKHWAEDLLEYLKPVDRHYFQVSWGEANPTKMNEHNVAVMIPRGKSFDEGMIIDPWRTAGKLFWLKVPQDKHYKWKPWAGYGTY